MSTLIIGSEGSMGKRYQAILKYLCEPYVCWDIASKPDEAKLNEIVFTQAIIASPTPTHAYYARWLLTQRKPFLCEKPFSLDPIEIQNEIPHFRSHPAYLVNNYAFTMDPSLEKPKLFYDYYKTGPHGLFWDCCQLLYLDPDAGLLDQSPFLRLYNHGLEITYRQIEAGYISMVKAFLREDYARLWTLDVMYKMQDIIRNRLENSARDSS